MSALTLDLLLKFTDHVDCLVEDVKLGLDLVTLHVQHTHVSQLLERTAEPEGQFQELACFGNLSSSKIRTRLNNWDKQEARLKVPVNVTYSDPLSGIVSKPPVSLTLVLLIVLL